MGGGRTSARSCSYDRVALGSRTRCSANHYRQVGVVTLMSFAHGSEISNHVGMKNTSNSSSFFISDMTTPGRFPISSSSSSFQLKLTNKKRNRVAPVSSATHAHPLWMVAEGLEAPVQLVYLTTLLGFLAVGAFVVTRQVLVKRELEEAAKALGERVRNQEATAEDYYELGVILLRKKLFTQANANLKKALKNWDEETGDEEIKAQVHNALGYSYFNLDRFEDAIAQYKKAVELQPGYLTAWNNLGDVMEKQKKYREALSAYQEVLGLDPSNVVAKERASYCKTRVDRAQGLL